MDGVRYCGITQQFIQEFIAQNYRSFRDLCEAYGISRKTGYKWRTGSCQVDLITFSRAGHLEFSKEYANVFMVKRLDSIGKNTVKAAQQSLKNDADNHKVDAWIINFIKQANS